jgi:pentatricopeptide repeat protein
MGGGPRPPEVSRSPGGGSGARTRETAILAECGMSSIAWLTSSSALPRTERIKLDDRSAPPRPRLGSSAVGLIIHCMLRQESAPAPASYQAALQACALGGQWAECLGLMEEMGARDLVPDASGFGAVIGACGAAGKWGKCLELLAKAEEGCVADEACYTATLEACARLGRFEEARAIVTRMKAAEGVGVDASTYQTVMWACVRG